LKEFAAFGRCSEREARQVFDSTEVSDNFESVALVNKEGLALGGIVHFLRIFRNKRIEEGIEPFIISTLGPKNPTLQNVDRFGKSCPNKADDMHLPSLWASCRRDPK
jgi:hypothetical protein